MRFVIEPSVEAFVRRGLAWLERDPVLNTLPATIARSRLAGTDVRDTGPAQWVTIEGDHGDVAGAAAAFTDRWSELTGCAVHTNARLRLYRLRRLEPPAGMPGTWRIAGRSDVDLCVEWFEVFADEVATAGRGSSVLTWSPASTVAGSDSGKRTASSWRWLVGTCQPAGSYGSGPCTRPVAPVARVRLGRDRRGDRWDRGDRRRRLPPHRPEQSDFQLDLPADRLSPGDRLRRVGVRAS